MTPICKHCGANLLGRWTYCCKTAQSESFAILESLGGSRPGTMKNEFPQTKLLRIGPTDAELAERWRFVAVMAMMFAVGGWLTVGALVLATIYR